MSITRVRRGIILPHAALLTGGGGGGGGSLTWTKSIDPNTYHASPAYSGAQTTFTSVPIGTASSDRYVVYGVARLGAETLDTTSSTCGGVSATKHAGGFSTSSNSVVTIYGALVTSGTTANIVVNYTTGATDIIMISGGYFTGSAAITEDGTETTQDYTYGDFTLPAKTPPSSGGMIVFMAGVCTDEAVTWGSGMAADYSYQSGSPAFLRLWSGHATTLGSSVTPSVTGIADGFMTGAAVGFKP